MFRFIGELWNIRRIFLKLDHSGDGEISLNEFVASQRETGGHLARWVQSCHIVCTCTRSVVRGHCGVLLRLLPFLVIEASDTLCERLLLSKHGRGLSSLIMWSNVVQTYANNACGCWCGCCCHFRALFLALSLYFPIFSSHMGSMFSALDKDGSGSVDMDEICQALFGKASPKECVCLDTGSGHYREMA